MADPEGELIGELRALAGAGKSDAFFIQRGPHRIQVLYSSGSSSSLTLRAHYDEVARADHEAIVHPGGVGAYRRSGRPGPIVAVRPLSIRLRTETPGDVGAKQRGIDVEHQTGDEAFDSNVYVSTPTTDDLVLAAVLGPKVRQGVLALLVLGFSYVSIDDAGCVDAYLNAFGQRTPRPGRGESAIAAFDQILSDLPAIAASGGAHVAHPPWARAVPLWILTVLVGGLAAPAWCGVADAAHCTESHYNADHEWTTTLLDGCGTPASLALLFAFAVAAVAYVLAGWLVTPRLRGRSDSSSRILHVRFAAFVMAWVATFLWAASYAMVHLRR